MACSGGDSIVIASAADETGEEADADIDSGSDTDTEADTDSDTDTEPEPDPPPNLLDNPGFEEEESSWSIWGGASRVEGQAHTGGWSVMATEKRRGTSGHRPEPNRVYRLSGWGMTTGADPLLIGVKDYGGEEMRVFFEESTYQEDSLELHHRIHEHHGRDLCLQALGFRARLCR